jgi:DNA-directed RNA polymerase specialized sigma24 family protein
MAKTRKRRPARMQRRAPSRAATPAASDGSAPAPIDLSALRARLETIAKSFAIVALRLTPVRPTTTQGRALLLAGLGLNATEIAAVLDSTPGSIAELISRARRK